MPDTVSTADATTFCMERALPERFGCLCPGCTEVFVRRYVCQCDKNAWLCAGCAGHLQATEVRRDDAGVTYRKPICAHHPTQLERLVCGLACINSRVEKQTRPALITPALFPLPAQLLQVVGMAASQVLLYAFKKDGSEIAKVLFAYRQKDHVACEKAARNVAEVRKK